MTNRDYLRSLSNEKLAELLDEDIICDKICDCMIKTCPDGSCTKCVVKWLDTERETHVEAGQIRETDSRKWLVTSVNVDHTNCSVLSEGGAIRDFPTDVVATWKIVTDETEEMFYNRTINNSYNNKEINK